MKVVTKIGALTVMLLGMTCWAGDSAPFLLDTTDSLITAPITYNSSWIGGDPSAEVVISADGTEIKRTTGVGEFAWLPTASGKHTLTYTTFINGVAQDEVYEVTVYADWKYTIEDGKATIVEAVQKAGDVAIPSEIDGYTIVGLGDGLFAGCENLTSITIPDSVISVEVGAFAGCTEIRSVAVPANLQIGSLESGLIQAKFNSSDDFTSSILDSESKSLVSGVLMGDAYDTESVTRTYTDPKYGGSHQWNSRYTTFGYAGYMYMVEGRTYVFGKYFDDSVLVRINGNEVLKNTDHTAFATGKYVPETTGWYEIEVRIADGTGEKGPKGVQDSGYWSGNLGVAWRDDGITDALPESGWNKMMDRGDGSLFRIGEYKAFTMSGLFPDSYAQLTNVILTGEVKEIPNGIFAGCSSLESFVIPNGVTKIGAEAFKDCISLVNVGMSDSIASIENSAFSGCNLLENVMISGNVKNIGDKAFCNCNSLISITIPDSVSRIGLGAFAGCSNIVNVSIGCFTGDSVVSGFYEAEFRSMDSFDDTLSIIDNSRGIVLSADMLTVDTTDEHTMYGYAANMYFEGGTEYTFKAYYDDKSSVRIDGVTVISAASIECRSQTYSVRYAESGWHQIELRGWNNRGGGAAYDVCEGILWRKGSESWQKFIDPGDGSRFCVNGSVVKSIKDIFPDSYNRVKGVTLTGEVTEIPENTFAGCAALESFVIPDGVIKIGDNAFEGCRTLAEIVIPDSVYSIGTNVFAICTGLKKVSMPFPLKAQVEAGNVFVGCSEDLEIVYREAEIKNVVAKQRYPWNGKVDISFEIEGNVFAGFSPNALPVLRVTAEDRKTGAKYIASETCLSGDTNLFSGVHKIVWDLRADGYEFRSDEVMFSASCAPMLPSTYCVIDLSAGESASSYPVTYLSDVPACGWTDEYKTTKLVLRRIEPGSFKMNDSYDVTLTKPYYCGVFEVTQKQYELVTGNRPSNFMGDKLPVESVSWDMIRGNSDTYNWPSVKTVDSNSFVGRLQAMTGLNIDLPTEAQWEYACRAGTTTVYNYGDSANSDYMWYYKSGTREVGLQPPNVWGLYDMHGNVYEWALDWYGSLASGSEPEGSFSGAYRVVRGGGWSFGAEYCASSYRSGNSPHEYYYDGGIRLAVKVDKLNVDALMDEFVYSGLSEPVKIDSRIELVSGSVEIAYNSSWVGGDSSAEVVISVDESEFMRVSGAGYFSWTPTSGGEHKLTYTTYIDGEAQDEVYETIVWVGDWRYELNDGKATITGTAHVSGDITIPDEIDGYPVVAVDENTFRGCRGLKSVTLPLAIFEGNIEQAPQVEKNNWIEGEDGVYQSNDINDSESTSMTLEVEGPCDFTFDWKVSSEGYCDNLKWYLDASQISEISGTGSDWQTVSNSIPEGSHTLRWEYSKDGSVSNGDDCGWVRFTESMSASVRMSNLFPDSYMAITNVVLTGEGERIPSYAFAGCSSLENVEIPESVTRIGTGAFNGCAAMADADGFLVIRDVLYGYFGDDSIVSIPNGVTDIAPKAFYGSVTLAEMVIPSTVVRIGAEAFANCTSLDRVVIPSSVTDIGSNAFLGCNSIKDATLPGWKCGINFSNVTNLVIAEGTTNIVNYAFQSCYSLESVTLPGSVTHIGYSAFSYCSNLKRVEIPDSVIAIGLYAFGSCNSELYDTTSIPGITLVDGWAIEVDKSKLSAELDLTNIRGIDGSTFRNCTSIERVTMPKNFISISDRMFYNCSSLKSVTIHDGVKNIGDSAFSGCSSLLDIIIPNSVTNIEGWAFYSCASLERVVIPDGVKGIGDSAFYGCEALAEVSLPDGLTECDIKSAFSETPFILSDTFPEFILSRSGKTLYGIKTKMFDSAMDWDDVYDEMECVDILVPTAVEYVGDYALGSLSAYIYNPDRGEYQEYVFSSGRVVFTGNKPMSSDKVFMREWSDSVVRNEVYYYEGNDGWTWNEDWCGVKTYSLPNIPNEFKVASDCTFGRTYGGGWWTDEWMSDGKLMQFTEYELWYNNDIGLYGDELAFFPVMTTESLIKPYILLDDTPAAYLDEVEVWTDEQVRRRFIPTGVSAGDWEDDDECWEYEDDDEYWYWPKDLWPDNRVVPGRKWIVVPVREVKEKWSGVSSFRVGVFGTSAISDPVLVFPVREEHEIFTKDVVSGFRGITIDGVEHLEEDEYTYWDDTIISGYQFVNWSQFENNLPMSFTITVPSAGTLVMASKYDEDESVVQAFSITGSGILSDRETEMSDDWDDLNYRWGITNFYKTGEADYVRRVKVSKGTTLTFTGVIQEDCECEFTRINFFPQEGRSVAVNVAYVCLEEMNGILGNEYWGRHYLKGYVKESGVYKKGETATFEAVSGEEEVFDHWEVCFGPLSLTESQRTSPRLSFVVTDEMCGDMADEAQIFLRAVWKPKYKITALPSIVGAGKVEGSGRYFAGDSVTLTATAATGCTFIKWSDGETSPTRTIEVVPADVERVIYAYFSAPDGVPDPLYWSVLFVGNGGEVGETDRLVRKGTPVGELPVPVMEGYEFLGWFTANEGGEEMRSDSVISRDLTLYARWKEVPRTPTELFGGEWKSGVEGTADAGGYKDSTVAGGVSVKFTAGHESEAWIETEVTNGCRVIFSWKANCEDLFKESPYDYLSFEVDGVLQGFVCGDKDWEDKSFVVSGKGVHRLRWRFCRDASGDGGADCAWLANVEITRIYTVEFTGGEATGGEAPGVMEYYEGESVELPDCGSLVRSKHTFAGWSDGTDIYQAGEEYSNDSDTTFKPVWTRNLLQKPVISAPSVFEADTCTVEITATDGAEVRYTLDGTDPTSGSVLYSGSIVISETTTVKAIAVKDNYFDSDVSVFVVIRGVWTFGEYLNSSEYTFVSSGDVSWTRAKGVSADGYALRSGKITHGQRSEIEMTVNGAGVISFDCRVEGEIEKGIVWDGLGFYVDGVRQGDLFGNDTWETKTFTVTGSGKHTLSWVYEKDIWGGDGNGEDCAWLDKVVWSSAASSDVTVDVGGGKSVVVPTEWIDRYEGIVSDAGGDKAAALIRTAANGRKVWECFMLGIDPTKADDDFKITRFWMENGKPMFEFSHSTDGAGNSFVSRLKVKGKAKLSDGWSEVPTSGDSSFRFFTVEVMLP